MSLKIFKYPTNDIINDAEDELQESLEEIKSFTGYTLNKFKKLPDAPKEIYEALDSRFEGFIPLVLYIGESKEDIDKISKINVLQGEYYGDERDTVGKYTILHPDGQIAWISIMVPTSLVNYTLDQLNEEDDEEYEFSSQALRILPEIENSQKVLNKLWKVELSSDSEDIKNPYLKAVIKNVSEALEMFKTKEEKKKFAKNAKSIINEFLDKHI